MCDKSFISAAGIDLMAGIRAQVELCKRENRRDYLLELFYVHVRRLSGVVQNLALNRAEVAQSDLFLSVLATLSVIREALPSESSFLANADSAIAKIESELAIEPSGPADLTELYSVASVCWHGGVK